MDMIKVNTVGFLFLLYQVASVFGLTGLNAVLSRRAAGSHPFSRSGLMFAAPPPKEEAEQSLGGIGREVFVRNVHYGIDAQTLSQHLTQFGTVTNASMAPRDERPDEHRGFGKVTFSSPDGADNAIAASRRGFRLMGRVINIAAYARPRAGDSRGALLQQFRNTRRRSDVQQILERIELHSVIEHNFAISAWGRVREWERAVALLGEMRQKGLVPDVFSFTSAISACEKSSQWERALELLSEMRGRGVEPNVVTYSAAISACEKGSQWERALELLSEMRQRGLEPNVITYSAAISACEKGSQWERALELLNEMQERGLEPNVITYSASISACEKGAQWARALELLNEMRALAQPECDLLQRSDLCVRKRFGVEASSGAAAQDARGGRARSERD